jgi:hypothetical protein
MRGRFAVIALPLGAFILGLAAFPPVVTLVTDESNYIRQAKAYADGHTRVQVRDGLTWEVKDELPSPYPPGTSLVQVPFVLALGWKGAAWASALALVVTVLVLCLWLRDLGLPPAFALLTLFYVPTLVLSRIGMGDVISGLVVTIGMWAFFRGEQRRWATPFAFFIAGASTVFRDSNPIFFISFAAGALWRHRRWFVFVSCGLLGLALRFALAQVLQGSAWMLHDPYPWSFAGSPERFGLYVLVLLVLVPGGLLAALSYRGPLRAEMRATVLLVMLFFSGYSYAGQSSGALRQLVLGPRYFIPLVPLLVVTLAEAATRRLAPRTLRRLTIGLSAGATILAVSVHPVVRWWSTRQELLVRTFYSNTQSGSSLVTEPGAIARYINELYGERAFIDRGRIAPWQLPALRSLRPVQLVFLDRNDSEYWRSMSADNARYVDSVRSYCQLQLRADVAPTRADHLRIWDVERCQ